MNDFQFLRKTCMLFRLVHVFKVLRVWWSVLDVCYLDTPYLYSTYSIFRSNDRQDTVSSPVIICACFSKRSKLHTITVVSHEPEHNRLPSNCRHRTPPYSHFETIQSTYLLTYLKNKKKQKKKKKREIWAYTLCPTSLPRHLSSLVS